MPESISNPDWTNTEDPQVKLAKRLASGPLGEMMTKFPLYYSKAIFFGERPKRENLTNINSASITLLQLKDKVFGITCFHVIEAYRQVVNEKGAALFQIGDTSIDLQSQLVDENKYYDLATILLTEEQVKKILATQEIGSRLIQPSIWPPSQILVSEKVMFGGFPGILRERVAFDEILFKSFSAAGISVASVDEEKFTCQFERDYWIASGNEKEPIDITELGGMSGGPAFVDRGQYFEFVGIIYEYSGAYDIMFFRHAGLIDEDGKIAT